MNENGREGSFDWSSLAQGSDVSGRPAGEPRSALRMLASGRLLLKLMASIRGIIGAVVGYFSELRGGDRLQVVDYFAIIGSVVGIILGVTLNSILTGDAR